MRFIKWAEQTFTSGGRETEVLPLLERCTRELRETRFEQYRDDARFLRVWVKYADLGKQPHDIFKFLETVRYRAETHAVLRGVRGVPWR